MSKTSNSCPAALRTEIVTTRSRLGELAEAWQTLHDQAKGGIFAHHGYLTSWAETLGRDTRLRVVLLWQGDRLMGALPMEHAGRARCWALMGYGRSGLGQWLLHPEFGTPGVDPAADRALGRMLRLPPFSLLLLEPLEAHDAEAMQTAASNAGLNNRRRITMRAARVDTRGTFDDFLKDCKIKTRSNFNRSERKLTVPAVRALRSDQDGDVAREVFIGASRTSWKAATGTGLGVTEDAVAFLTRLSERLGPKVCFFAARSMDGTPVNGRFTLVHRGVHYGMAGDFNEAFAKLGAGRNSLMHWIKDAFDDDARALDLMRTNTLAVDVATDHRSLERVLVSRRLDPAVVLFFAGQLRRRIQKRLSGWKKGRRGTRFASGAKGA